MTPDFRRALLVGAIVGVAGGVLTGELLGLVCAAAGGIAVATVVLLLQGLARRFQRPGVQPLPFLGFVAWGIVPTFYAASILAQSPADPAGLALGAFTVAWWLVGILLVRGVRGAVVPALALVAVQGLVVLALEVRRTAFVMGRGDVEAAEYGFGGSAADLQLYWMLEAIFVFLPLTAIAMCLAAALRSEAPPAT
jgi:hypothetical protein